MCQFLSLIGEADMRKYISFMDLLGTKSIAISDALQYRELISNFQKILKHLSKEQDNIKMYVFSDCAYFESSDIIKLCLFLRKLREKLLFQRICFNAAVCEGQLKVEIDGYGKENMVMVDFKCNEVVKVYRLQSQFSGAGIYIDPNLLKNSKTKELLSEIMVKSIYQNFDKFVEKYNFFECFDIKFERESEKLLEYILNLYYSCYILDKKAARYYYTLYATYLAEQSINFLLQNDRFIVNKVINISNKISDGEDKLVIVLLLVNRLYNAQLEELEDSNEMELINEKLKPVFNYIYDNTSIDKLYNIKKIDSKILNDKNKYWLSKFCFTRNLK